MSPADSTPVTPGQTTFLQGEPQGQPLFRIEPGIPCQHAREQASEILGCVCDLMLSGIMDSKPQWLWSAYYLNTLAKALLDDAEKGVPSPL
ncbi:DUF3077 domain-containing protein [Pseudomonas sp. MLB6B]